MWRPARQKILLGKGMAARAPEKSASKASILSSRD